jgi:hypothetical protein
MPWRKPKGQESWEQPKGIQSLRERIENVFDDLSKVSKPVCDPFAKDTSLNSGEPAYDDVIDQRLELFLELIG